jgi:hypothetical protein
LTLNGRLEKRTLERTCRSILASISEDLLAAQFPMRKGVRLLGVSLSSLGADPAEVDPQITLAL